jgi:predicted Zn-dependent protease
MDTHFITDADLPEWRHAPGCGCRLHGRRRWSLGLFGLGAASAWPAWANEGVDVGKSSRFAKLVPAQQVEQAAAQQFVHMQQQARQKNALAPEGHPQLVRLHYIAKRLIPFTPPWNPRATQWRWEVILIGSPQINAFCMPGGKIAFFWGILQRLQLSDDEVAMIMGHEMAHALREHARERMGRQMATETATVVGALALEIFTGVRLDPQLAGTFTQAMFVLPNSRENEQESDFIGVELAARGGYDPRAALTLWQKMAQASGGGTPEWLSTHPSSETRLRDLQGYVQKVMPLYEKSGKPSAPPAK